MKSFILGTLAATMLVSPMMAAPAAAQYRDNDRRDDQRPDGQRGDQRDGRRGPGGHARRDDRGPQFRNFRRGERFDQRYARDYREVNYRNYRGLRAPPRGYHWVRSGNDALLVALGTGIIASVIAGSIR